MHSTALKVKDDVSLKSFKPTPVPSALRDKIVAELDRLEQNRSLECSDWAAPIVPAMKADGSVCMCGDFKVTVHPCLHGNSRISISFK